MFLLDELFKGRPTKSLKEYFESLTEIPIEEKLVIFWSSGMFWKFMRDQIDFLKLIYFFFSINQGTTGRPKGIAHGKNFLLNTLKKSQLPSSVLLQTTW